MNADKLFGIFLNVCGYFLLALFGITLAAALLMGATFFLSEARHHWRSFKHEGCIE